MKKYISILIAAIFFITIFPLNLFADDEIDPINVRDSFAKNYLANYVVSYYNTGSNDFPTDECNTVLQSKDGYMWFGCYNGLIRYDGEKFTVWNAATDGFVSSSIRVTHEGADGSVWIGTNDRGVVKYKDGKFKFFDKSNEIVSNSIRDIAEAPDGKVYFSTPDGVFYIQNDVVTKIILDIDVQPFVTAICCDKQNNLFCVLNDGSVYVYTPEGKTVKYNSDMLFYSIKCLPDNRIAIGSQGNEVVFIDFDGSTFNTTAVVKTILTNITNIHLDTNGLIWIAAGTGIGIIDKNLTYHNVGNFNYMGFYTDICGDYENGYWFTSSKGGVVKLSVGAFTNVNDLLDLDTGTVNAVVNYDGNTYIGTNTGFMIVDTETGKPVNKEFTDTITSRVRGIFLDSSSNIWICTYSDNGIIRYNPQTMEHTSWFTDDGLVSEKTRCFVEMPNGVAAIGTGAGVTFIKGDKIISANEAFETTAVLDMPDIMILSMTMSKDGTLFIGTDGNGVYAVNKDGSKRYNEENGISGEVILRLCANENTNGIWIGSSTGLSYIDELGTASIINKVPPYSIFDIKQYNNELILLTSSMIVRTHADSLIYPDVPFEATVTDKSQGLTSSINANSWNWIENDGSFYICCDNGINRYSLNAETTPFVPYAGINSIDIDGVIYTDYTDTIIIPSNATRITFDFSYLSYGLLSNATLNYMLVGQDNEEIAIDSTLGETFDVSYTNLKGGNYTLKVRTIDANGNVGNEIKIQLKKELNFFEHAYVWIIIAIALILVIILITVNIIKFKSHKLYLKQQEYRTIISQALTAIANTIDAKDSYTSGHSARVAAYSVEIARRLGRSQDFLENIYYIGLLHDVGKIAISNEILNKPGRLSYEEYSQMKQHPRVGMEILKDITTINHLTAGAAEHHERWDGNGYYQGISGEKISLEGRIIAAADAYDAMSTDRAYRQALSNDIILDEFKRFKGKQFDPKIADIVIDMIEHDDFASINVNKIIGINENIEPSVVSDILTDVPTTNGDVLETETVQNEISTDE